MPAHGGSAGWLTVSDSHGSGTLGGHLYVYRGSTVANGGGAVVGDESGEYGWAIVDGAGSSWTNGGSLYVGSGGSGTLECPKRRKRLQRTAGSATIRVAPGQPRSRAADRRGRAPATCGWDGRRGARPEI